ncbi:serine hydrolase domain-containing protein [Nocardia sp. NPDC003693]
MRLPIFGAPAATPGEPVVHGHSNPEYAAAVELFGRLVAGRGGGALAVYHHGEPVVDVWAGSAGDEPWQRETAAVSYSTTKGITVTVLHLLAERGLLDYRAPVAEYWPEFGAAGKSDITVAELLSHRAGLSRVGAIARRLDDLVDHDLMIDRIAAAAPDETRGVPAYHAITFGWLTAGLARAITGKSMGELYRTELVNPLGLDRLQLGGVPGPGIARSHGSGLPLGIPLAALAVRAAAPLYGAGFVRSVHAEGVERFALGPDPLLLRGENPAANGVFSARAVAAVYNEIATPGRLLPRERVRAMLRVQTRRPDRNLLLPMGWRLGHHSYPVPGATHAIGHIGLAGSGGWADPRSGLAVGFVHNWLPEIPRLPVDQLALSRLLIPIVRASGSGGVERVRLAG